MYLGSPYAKDLIFAAVDKSDADANVFAAAYFLAVNAGLDDDKEISKWLQKAIELSGDEGPIQKKSLKDFLEWKPDWDRNESETWRLLSRGEIPMFLAAQNLNKSLIDLMLFPTLANQKERDPRRRGMIPAYSGNRKSKTLNVHGTIGLEATALLTLGFLGLLGKIIDVFDQVYVPHSTLMWLFEEKQKVAFHQPSKIKDAHRVQNLLASGVLEKLIPGTIPDGDLSAQIDDDLVLLIAEAEKERDDDVQRIVVRSSPVHRLDSLMDEEADLTSHMRLC